MLTIKTSHNYLPPCGTRSPHGPSLFQRTSPTNTGPFPFPPPHNNRGKKQKKRKSKAKIQKNNLTRPLHMAHTPANTTPHTLFFQLHQQENTPRKGEKHQNKTNIAHHQHTNTVN